MTQYPMNTAFSKAVTRDRVSAGLNRIALAVGLLSSNRASKSKLALWLVDHATLVITLIAAHRKDAAATRRALAEIEPGGIRWGQEVDALEEILDYVGEEAAQDAAEEEE